MAEAALRIPKVKASPTTLQFQRHKLRDKPFYKPGFSMTKEQWQKTMTQPEIGRTDPLMPPYPYGKNAQFPEANYGLYGGTTIVSGNKISSGRNKGKTVRKWFPNIRFETIRSEALDTDLHIPIRARVMRTIRKAGGLDEYLLGGTTARMKDLGLLGWKLRWLVMKSPKMQQRFAAERAKYGLPQIDHVTQTFEDVWNDREMRKKLINQQDRAWTRLREKMQTFEKRLEKQWDPSDQPERSYADRAMASRGTLSERRPSKMELPDMIQELEIRDRRELEADT